MVKTLQMVPKCPILVSNLRDHRNVVIGILMKLSPLIQWDFLKTYRPSPILFEIFIIFIIKTNTICANNNPKLQNLFKKSEVMSKRKSFFIVGKSSILDLIEFLDLPVLNHIATTLYYHTKDLEKDTKNTTPWKVISGRSKRFSER